MAVTTASFKMKKELKRLCANFTDPVARGVYKRMMMDAQVSYERAKKESLKQKRNSGDSEE